jgi:hypothetical protein
MTSFQYNQKRKRTQIKIGDTFLTVVVFGRTEFSIGDRYKLSFDHNKYLIFNQKSRRLLSQGKILLFKEIN